MRVPEDKTIDTVNKILESNIEAEDLCRACGASEEDASADITSEVLGSFDQYIEDTFGVDGKTDKKKIKGMKEELKKYKKELQGLKLKKTKTHCEEELEGLEEEIEQQSETCEDIEGCIRDAEDRERNQAAIIVTAKPSRRLIERVISQCSRTYARQCEKEQRRELYSIFKESQSTVLKSIQRFRYFTSLQAMTDNPAHHSMR